MRFGVLRKVDDSIKRTVFVPHSDYGQTKMRGWCDMRAAAEAVVFKGRRRRLAIFTVISIYRR